MQSKHFEEEAALGNKDMKTTFESSKTGDDFASTSVLDDLNEDRDGEKIMQERKV